MSYLNDFKTQLDRKNLQGVLQLWEEYCAGDEVDGKELIEILDMIRKSDLADAFGKHSETIIPLWEKMADRAQADEVLRLMFDLDTSNSARLATLGFEILQERYGNLPFFQDKIRLVGLRGKDSFRGAIRNFELLNHLNKGKFVFHTGGWGTGEIRDVSLVREQLLIEFDLVPGRKEISFASAFKHLLPLPQDHFLSQRFGNPDALEKKAKEDPVAVVKMLLKDLGPKTASEIKEEMSDLVIPAEEWTRWWQAARNKLKKDSMVECPEDLKTPFQLREQEVSHEQRMITALQTKMDIASVISLVYSFLRDFPEVSRRAELRSSLCHRVEEMLASPEATEAQKFQMLFLLEDLEAPRQSEFLQLLSQMGDVEELLQQIEILAYKKRFLVALRKHVAEWATLFSRFLLNVGQAQLREYMVEELIRSGHTAELERVLAQLMQDPVRSPDAYVWFFSKLMTGAIDGLPFNNSQGHAKAFEAFLVLFAALEQQGKDRDLQKKMHALLNADRYAIVRRVMEQASLAEVKEFLLLATKSPTLNDQNIKIFISLAEVHHPELGTKTPVHSDEDVIWTSQEGLQRVQERLKQIATVDTVENAREIEAARALGDLRENSEFKFALEKRDRLQQEIKVLGDQIKKARIFTKEDIPSEEAGVGSVVEVEDSQGRRVSYTLLGPWDADPERHILSFQSKAAQAMVGKGVGDAVQIGHEHMRIVGLKGVL
jgi:transcription elongation factor GreA-like protein/transcription elongation GreA/GreB family factor